MNIADDLVRAFNEGYKKGKADAEAYMLHCGDTDDPQTNADRIRSMTDEELAEYLFIKTCEDGFPQFTTKNDWLDWLKEEVDE